MTDCCLLQVVLTPAPVSVGNAPCDCGNADSFEKSLDGSSVWISSFPEDLCLFRAGSILPCFWLTQFTEQGYEVVCFLANVGQEEDWDAVKAKAAQIGATKMYVPHWTPACGLATDVKTTGSSRTCRRSSWMSSASAPSNAMPSTSSGTFWVLLWPVQSSLVPRCEVMTATSDISLSGP